MVFCPPFEYLRHLGTSNFLLKIKFFAHFALCEPFVSSYAILGIFDLRMRLHGRKVDKNQKIYQKWGW